MEWQQFCLYQNSSYNRLYSIKISFERAVISDLKRFFELLVHTIQVTVYWLPGKVKMHFVTINIKRSSKSIHMSFDARCLYAIPFATFLIVSISTRIHGALAVYLNCYMNQPIIEEFLFNEMKACNELFSF